MATPGTGDFEALARQYWDFWTDAMRKGADSMAAAAQAPAPDARMSMPPGDGLGEDMMQTMGAQARAWYTQMQQLAAQFAGRDADPREVADAWRRMMGGMAGGNVFADLLRGMQVPGQQGFEAWYEQVRPFLQGLPAEAWQREARAWLNMPAFGFAREHQERWQKLAQAHLDYIEQSRSYQSILGEATQDAFARFERKLVERGEAGQPVTSARALFDLWIDAAEEAYAEVALSPRFRDAFGRFVNAQMRLRGALQREVEHMCGLLGMPTRTEVDAAHRKVTRLERELRSLRDAVARLGEAGARAGADAGASRRESAPRSVTTKRDAQANAVRDKAPPSAKKKAAGKKKRAG